jgi:hypothetical protein
VRLCLRNLSLLPCCHSIVARRLLQKLATTPFFVPLCWLEDSLSLSQISFKKMACEAPQAPSINRLSGSTQVEDAMGVSEWPQLIGLKKLHMKIEQPTHWTDHTCPKELEAITKDTPLDVVRMIQQSLAKELYTSPPVVGQAIAATQAPDIPSVKPTQVPSNTRDSLKNDTSQVSRASLSASKGSRSSSKLSPGTTSSRSPLGWITAKAPKEMRCIKILLRDRNTFGSVPEFSSWFLYTC